MHAIALPPNALQYMIGGAVVLLMMAFRMSRMTRQRRLRVEQLWIVPAIFTIIAVLVMVATPPALADAPWLILALALGGVVGWYRGKIMRITVDPETHALNQSASPTAVIFILVIFAIRYGVRYGLGEEAAAWHISVNLLTDAPLLFIVGMFTLTRVEMYIRAQRLLREARAARPTSAAHPPA
ncbi:hypothetical protein [Terricaulis sp.]|uniref:hypothetical protein n=1 Tax=Terricaulis sp. TaxID=2768686 RepID=UPI0037849079